MSLSSATRAPASALRTNGAPTDIRSQEVHREYCEKFAAADGAKIAAE